MNIVLAFVILLGALRRSTARLEPTDVGRRASTPARPPAERAAARRPDRRRRRRQRGDRRSDAARADRARTAAPGTPDATAARPRRPATRRSSSATAQTRDARRSRPRYDAEAKRPLLGFSFGDATIDARAVGEAARRSRRRHVGGHDGDRRRRSASSSTTPRPARRSRGVVGSYEATRQAFEFDTDAGAARSSALISLSLAVVNLFPFLPLDGGHIFWALAEKVRGRPIPFASWSAPSVVGFVLVIVLFVIGLTNDIDRLRSGEGFGRPVASAPRSADRGARHGEQHRARRDALDEDVGARPCRGVPPHRGRARRTASRSARRTTRSRSPGASCASASTRWPAGLAQARRQARRHASR